MRKGSVKPQDLTNVLEVLGQALIPSDEVNDLPPIVIYDKLLLKSADLR